MIEALIAFAVLLGLIMLRVPVGLGMIAVGFAGFGLMVGWPQAMAMVGQVTYDTGLSYELVILPLFILMGNFIAKSGYADGLYSASYAFLGHHRGGLAMATVVACGGFSAICGSSFATAATMAKVAMPSMRKYGYADSLAMGSIAGGGTLGIMIPPSVIMVIFGLITETNIGEIFIAGVLPGLLGVLGYMAAVYLTVKIRPDYGPRGERTPWRGRLQALKQVWGIVAIFLLVIGGIYGGVFTTVEAAGIGATGAFVLALSSRRLSWRTLYDILRESAQTTAMLFVVVIGAMIFSNVINLTGVTMELTAWVQDAGLSPWMVILFIIVCYLALGCLLESISMILLTVPTFFPLVTALGFDPVWFAVVVVLVTEIGLITPPVGLNIFVLKGVQPDVSTGTIFRGVMPFLTMDFIRLAVIVMVPAVSLFLPGLMR
ncbi:TRAP transporter large permease [Pusillimonas caeni]|uniref:TRAP transporter large permease n=1 Tax=Pusillimonas caeni TaxID=1348472 RepID=UPI000E59B5FA|nr:TRAP transporter large permease [Pusillimonas caeni]TFL14771.1 TRAP transporter large permease [Pusillimonas caeni]